MKIKILALLCCLLPWLNMSGQTDDFGLWTGLNVEYDLNNKTSINLNSCLRTFQNTSSTDLFYIESGISHKLFKRFSVGGYYRYILKNEDFSGFFSRHRLFVDFKYTYPVSRLKLSLRLRLQGQFKTFKNSLSDKIPDYYCRIKAKVDYNWPSFPVNPFVSAEMFHPLNDYEKPFIDKNRYSLGIEIKCSKKISIDLAYILDNEEFPRPVNMHIIATDLNISL